MGDTPFSLHRVCGSTTSHHSPSSSSVQAMPSKITWLTGGYLCMFAGDQRSLCDSEQWTTTAPTTQRTVGGGSAAHKRNTSTLEMEIARAVTFVAEKSLSPSFSLAVPSLIFASVITAVSAKRMSGTRTVT